MVPRQERVRLWLGGLAKFVALVAVAGGLGVGLGIGLVALSGGDTGTPPIATGEAQSENASQATTANAATTPAPTTSTATTTPAPTTTETTTAPAPATGPRGALGRVQVRVLGAILRPAGTPDGRRRHRSRLTMRVQAVNQAGGAVTIQTAALAVGSVRIRPDGAAQTAVTSLGQLAAGETKAVTLRFELAGDATDKLTVDRRARLAIAGRSLAFRVRVGAPVAP